MSLTLPPTQGGENPDLLVRELETGFPLLNSTEPGSSEGWQGGYGGSWGHMSPTALSQARIHFQRFRYPHTVLIYVVAVSLLS